MEKSSEYYFELITRYFADEASEKEKFLLSAWISQSADNRSCFIESGKIFELISKSKIESEINVEHEWNNLESRITTSFEKESRKWTLQKNSYKSKFRFIKIAASVTLFLVASYALYFYLNKPNNILYVTQNKSIECLLPDKSQVTLNTGSIEFQEEFNNRKVNLNGEAFFDVVHNEQKPFIIDAGDIIVEDIGTSFYVNTNSSDNKVTIILKTGKVALYTKDDPSVKYYLEPGEKAEYSITNKDFVTSINNDYNYEAWRTKEMVFKDNTLNEIVSVLNKVYHSNITFNNDDIKQCKLTAEFKNQTLEAILNVLQATLNLNITKSHSGIEISGNGCK